MNTLIATACTTLSEFKCLVIEADLFKGYEQRTRGQGRGGEGRGVLGTILMPLTNFTKKQPLICQTVPLGDSLRYQSQD